MLNNFRRRRPLTALTMRMRLNFACFIFVARTDYENILTAKISRCARNEILHVYNIYRVLCLRPRSQGNPRVAGGLDKA